MLWTLLLACQSATPSWGGMFTAAEVSPDCPPVTASVEADPATSPEATPSPAFGQKPQICIDDPFACDSQGNILEAEPESLVVVEVVPVPQPTLFTVEPDPEPTADLPAPVGLATQAAWGVRLLQTMPNAQPPRAALGLPDGTEVVVSPGSMLVEPGIIVISVGPDRAQLAKVRANGDHAEIETLTLFAQY